MRFLVASIAFLSGVALASQVGMNRTLGSRMSSPILATLTSFAIGTSALLLYVLATRPPLPDRSSLANGPWWIWCGGFVGAAYLTAAASLSGRLGAAAWFGLIVTGQVVGSLVLDHFGMVGFKRQPITPTRLFGAICLLGGVILFLLPPTSPATTQTDLAATTALDP